MEPNEYSPKNLTDAIRYFSSEDRCIAYMVSRRWPDGIVKCPVCGSAKVHFLANQRRWKCSSSTTVASSRQGWLDLRGFALVAD